MRELTVLIHDQDVADCG